jgi:hypothetical protein
MSCGHMRQWQQDAFAIVNPLLVCPILRMNDISGTNLVLHICVFLDPVCTCMFFLKNARNLATAHALECL